jgi:hypothetical protein
MTLKLTKEENLLLAALLSLLLVAVFAPAVAQPAHHHAFSDQRAWSFIPCAMDVLSNLAFALWGLAGLTSLARQARQTLPLPAVQHGLAVLFFAGLLVITAASAWYHWQPDDAGLAVDRLGMVAAFAGLLGLAASDRISGRAGVVLASLVLVLGPISIGAWVASGNVLPWVVVQFGGMALVLGLACLKPLPGALAVRWGLVIAIYAVAKWLEQADAAIYIWTSGLIAGHSLKHVVAGCAAWPVMAAMLRAGKIRAESASPSPAGWGAPAGHKRLPQNN